MSKDTDERCSECWHWIGDHAPKCAVGLRADIEEAFSSILHLQVRVRELEALSNNNGSGVGNGYDADGNPVRYTLDNTATPSSQNKEEGL